MDLAPLHGLLTSRMPTYDDPLVGAVAVPDTDLPETPATHPVAVRITGGAGQIAGPAALCGRRGLDLRAITVTLRDLDDPVGNTRRVVAAVDAARAQGSLPETVAVRIALPARPPGHGWLAAADEIAAAEFEAALPFGSDTEGGRRAPSATVARWIDALLDRELGFAALDVTAAPDALALLTATATAWNGGGSDAVAATLETTSGPVAIDMLVTGHRWCRSIEVRDGQAVAGDIRRLL